MEHTTAFAIWALLNDTRLTVLREVERRAKVARQAAAGDDLNYSPSPLYSAGKYDGQMSIYEYALDLLVINAPNTDKLVRMSVFNAFHRMRRIVTGISYAWSPDAEIVKQRDEMLAKLNGTDWLVGQVAEGLGLTPEEIAKFN